MKLIIVESPTKCDTIKRYLGQDYQVMASKGHIRDLATSGKGGLGVDVDNGFKATYVVNKKQTPTVRELQKAVKEADEVILATDPDREGEAIAWHLAQVLKLDTEKTKRLEFHEITRDSITSAIETPRNIDLNLVESQETRRIVDRIIGFKLSSLLFKKMKSRSAGRVQSATLKIIADHDSEIKAFVPEEYWKIMTIIVVDGKEIPIDLKSINGKDSKVTNGVDAQKVIDQIPNKVKVTKVKKEVKSRESKEPFITSTLQQAAYNKFKYKTSKTQLIAQKLYEGISLKDEHVGLITYMRTDSTRLSSTFIQRAKSYIIETFGEEYVGRVKGGKEKDNELSQDAHEAIRPTGNHRTPQSLKPYLPNDEYNIYKLIYDRAVASLMAPKKEEVTNVMFEGNGLTFNLQGTHTIFEGYEALYRDDEDSSSDKNLPVIEQGNEFEIVKKSKEQAFTQPPAHYSEAKIVKIMEDVGIGRPSTYASTIAILQKRKYVSDTNGILITTEQGWKTAHVLDKYFPNVVNAEYTASMEEKLDNIVDGSESRIAILNDFYHPFMTEVEKANKIMYKDKAEPTGEMCPKCGSPLVYKEGQNGKFVGCSNYPECKYVKKEPKKPAVPTGEMCPTCGKPLVERQDKRGRKFVGCSGYPECHYIKPEHMEEEKQCPKCGGSLVKKKGKYGYFLGCSNYPSCNYMEKIAKKGN